MINTCVPSQDTELTVHHDGATAKGGDRLAIHTLPIISGRYPTETIRLAPAAKRAVGLSKFFQMKDTTRFIWKLPEKFVCRHNFLYSYKGMTPQRNLFTYCNEMDRHFLVTIPQ